MEDSKFQKRGQVDLPAGKRDDKEEGGDQLDNVRKMVVSSANLMLQHLCVCTFLKALEKAGFLERVRILSATKKPKDDRTAEAFEDYQVQYFLIETPTAADDGPVTKDHEKIPAVNESVLQYSAGCIPFPAPGGGKGSVDDSGNFSLAKDTNGDNLSSEMPAPPFKKHQPIAHASCHRSGSGSDDPDSPTPPSHADTFVEYNHDEEEDEEIQGPVQVSGVNGDSWSNTIDRIRLQYTTDDRNISSDFLTSPVEEDSANIVQPQPVPSLLDTGQQVSDHPMAKPPRMDLHHHSPLDTGQQVSDHPMAKPPRMDLHHHSPLDTGQQVSDHPMAKPPWMELHHHSHHSPLDTGQQVSDHPMAKPPDSLKDKEEVLVTPEEESVMPFSQVVITHNPTAENEPHEQTPPGHGPFSSPLALDDQHSITDDHVYLACTTPVEESGNPGGSACLVTGRIQPYYQC